MEAVNLFPSHVLILELGLVVMKERTTMMVLANMQETATEKMTPKAVC